MSEENLPPDVASMVKRLRLLPVKISECEEPRWEDFPKDQREGLSRETAYSLGHAAGVLNAVQVAQPEIDALAALLSRLGQGWVPVSKEEATRLVKEDGAFQISDNPIFIRQRRMSQEWFRFDAPPLPSPPERP